MLPKNTIYKNKRPVLDLDLLSDKELEAAYEAIKRELRGRDQTGTSLYFSHTS